MNFPFVGTIGYVVKTFRTSERRSSVSTVNNSKPTAPKSHLANHRVQALANLLEQDIRRRGLRPGDRYVTSEEAARMLEVSTGKVHQVMRYLVDKNVLDRRRKQGTFVGGGAQPAPTNVRPKIYVLTPADGARDSSYSRWAHQIFPAISKSCSGASLQLEYLPNDDQMGFVRSLFENEERNGGFVGFILLRSSYEIQELFQENIHRYAAITLGDVFPGITRLPSISHDQCAIGKQCIEYVVSKGHRRILMTMLDTWAAGDNQLMHGINGALQTMKQSIERFELSSLPSRENVLRNHVRELLSSENRPTVVIARMSSQISIIHDVARELGIGPEDLEVVLASISGASQVLEIVTHWESAHSIDKVSELLADVLVKLRNGEASDSIRSLLDVKMVERAKLHL